ncbi:AraC family transcriptional regulator [Microbacterium sp. EST19A]|uniref:AraC family transcriptional regulator n=1 Tax=Microbacterium sp. EST19A TaxID=2862681 RepID=UPI001CBD5551|nr:AraC family transcriptional regulator [Microbacterium sp. EST19A]
MEYESVVPQPPLDGLIDDLYFLEGAPPYPRLTLPPMPGSFLIINLGDPFHIRAGGEIAASAFTDGCVVSPPTRALEFGYPTWTRSIGVHFQACGLAPFVPMPVSELCDRPATLAQVWGRGTVERLQEELVAASEPVAMLAILENELVRRMHEVPGLDMVRRASSAIVETGGTVAIGELASDAGVSSTHLTQRFREIVGIAPKRFARTRRLAATLLAIDFAEPIDWADVATRAGYFDQAHFGHEFRAFTGLTPTRYVEVRRRFLREHPDHALDNWSFPTD